MASELQNTAAPLTVTKPVPPLEPGDRLTRAEFERRYEAMPHLKKAELIEGIVYMQSAVRLRAHASPHGHLVTWLGVYEANTPGVLMGDNSSLRLDLDNMPQPDAAMFVDPDAGGQVEISDDDYVEGAPEFVGEVASSSASYDLGVKLNVYRRSGVQEYLVWRVLDEAIDWFVLREGNYEPLEPDENGIHRSEGFPGLWLDVESMMDGKMASVLTVLQDGIASPPHSDFVERLRQRRA